MPDERPGGSERGPKRWLKRWLPEPATSIALIALVTVLYYGWEWSGDIGEIDGRGGEQTERLRIMHEDLRYLHAHITVLNRKLTEAGIKVPDVPMLTPLPGFEKEK